MNRRRQEPLGRRLLEVEQELGRLRQQIDNLVNSLSGEPHRPIAYLGRTVSSIPAKTSLGVLGAGVVEIYEVDATTKELATQRRVRAYNFAKGAAQVIATETDCIVLEIGEKQLYVIIWILCP